MSAVLNEDEQKWEGNEQKYGENMRQARRNRRHNN